VRNLAALEQAVQVGIEIQDMGNTDFGEPYAAATALGIRAGFKRLLIGTGNQRRLDYTNARSVVFAWPYIWVPADRNSRNSGKKIGLAGWRRRRSQNRR
jgi:hypothetical protein